MDKKEIYTKLLNLCMKEYRYDHDMNSTSLLALMKHCIDNGANVNSMGSYGETLLCIACETNIKVVKLLVKAGADVNLKSENDYPIQVAIANNKFEIIKFLLENGVPLDFKSEIKKYTLLHYAATTYSIEIIEFLLAKGLDVNALDFDGNTPLHHACNNWEHPDIQTEIIKLLLEHGADVSMKNKKEITPLGILDRIKTDIAPELIPLLKSYAKKKESHNDSL